MGNQSLLLLGVILQMARHNPRYRLAAVAHEHFLTVPYKLDMSAKLCLQIADIYGLHVGTLSPGLITWADKSCCGKSFGFSVTMKSAWPVSEHAQKGSSPG